ncbi:hypothetical protein I4U23_017059 [Adineta vaga]|nr:hypothetical protein I4U23_017059 [Adineta vaga]
MATSTTKIRCVRCAKEKSTVQCDGCLQSFCLNHFNDHQQQLNLQFDQVQNNRDRFRQTLNEYSNNSHEHDQLVKQIDQWEKDSIEKIRQTAEETRNTLRKYTNQSLSKIEIKLNQLTKELQESQKENGFMEKDFQRWNQQLDEMNEEINKPSNIQITNSSTPLINKINVDLFRESWVIPNINVSATWIQNGITIAGGNGQGNELNQLSSPYSIYIDNNETMYIADGGNHRIVEWKIGTKESRVVAGGNGRGNRNDQLNGPTNVIVDEESDSLIISDTENRRIMRWSRRDGKSGEIIVYNVTAYGIVMDNERYLYTSDWGGHEVRRWKIGDRNGILVAGGNGKGNRFDQLDGPRGIFIDQDDSLYVVDQGNHRVMKWVKDAEEGIVVAGGHGQGNSLSQLYYPWGVVVDQLGTVYVADQINHRVMRWCLGAKEGSIVVGRNGYGPRSNQLYYPLNLSFDRDNSLYVVDCNNYRIQKFNKVD